MVRLRGTPGRTAGVGRRCGPAERRGVAPGCAALRAPLAEALETLADDQREALKLRVIDGLPYPDVAARLDCAETAARQRVSRGLRRLALVLQERGLMLTAEVE